MKTIKYDAGKAKVRPDDSCPDCVGSWQPLSMVIIICALLGGGCANSGVSNRSGIITGNVITGNATNSFGH